MCPLFGRLPSEMAPKLIAKGVGPRGIRERLGLAKASPKAKPPPAPLAVQLKTLFRQGKVTARDVGDTAAAASSSSTGSAPPDIARLAKAKAKVGPAKHASRNSSRSLMRTLHQDSHACPQKPYMAKVPMWDPDKIAPVEQDCAFLPLHETLGELVQAADADRWTSFSEDQSGFETELHQWGDRVGADTRKGHWATIGLWGDSAPTVKKDSVFLLSFTFLAGVIRQRFWVTAFNKSKMCQCGCKGRCTIDIVFAVVAWSVRSLITGQYPAHDHLGNTFPRHSMRGKLAGKSLPVRGAAIRKFGDWVWFKQALGLRGHQGEGDKVLICWLCKAGRSDPACYCWDFGRSAAWRATTTFMSEFWQEQYEQRSAPSPIWQIPGFIVRYCIPEFMHVCCLGVLQYLSGNVLWELFRELGSTLKQSVRACGILQNMASVSAKALKIDCPISKMTRAMFCPNSGKPKASLKAAQGRYFLKVLHHMLGNLVDRATDHAKLRYNCVSALVEVYKEMEHDVWKNDGSSNLRVADCGRRHLLLYAELSGLSRDSRKWRLYPKHHLMDHVAGRCVVNPRLEWSYLDEAEIGVAAVLASVSNQSTIETELLQRYRATCKPEL